MGRVADGGSGTNLPGDLGLQLPARGPPVPSRGLPCLAVPAHGVCSGSASWLGCANPLAAAGHKCLQRDDVGGEGGVPRPTSSR